MTRLRKRAAQRLLSAQHENALLTTFNEVNMQPVIDLRKRYRDAFLEHHGVKLGFMSFFVKASVEALQAVPAVNARIDGAHIVYRKYQDVGEIATRLPDWPYQDDNRHIRQSPTVDRIMSAFLRHFGDGEPAGRPAGSSRRGRAFTGAR